MDEEEKVHLTADAIHVDVEGHRTHHVFRIYQGDTYPGRAAPLRVQCSCGRMFLLSDKPKQKP